MITTLKSRYGVSVGDTINRLTLIGEMFHSPEKSTWRGVFSCSCGNYSVADVSYVKRGRIRSCGCLALEVRRSSDLKYKKHGLTKNPVYNVWSSMMGRCHNPNVPNYINYGGRGIKVCKPWHDVKVFYDWAISNGYKDELQLDRIDNNKGYSPDNCRFVTCSENCNNKRTNLWITAFGKRKTCIEWSKDVRCKVSAGAIRHRINRGWPSEKAITSPLRYKKKSK